METETNHLTAEMETETNHLTEKSKRDSISNFHQIKKVREKDNNNNNIFYSLFILDFLKFVLP